MSADPAARMTGAPKIVLAITQSNSSANGVKDGCPVTTSGSTTSRIPASRNFSRSGPSFGDIAVTKKPASLHHFAIWNRISGAPLQPSSCETKSTFALLTVVAGAFRPHISIGVGESAYNQSRMFAGKYGSWQV